MMAPSGRARKPTPNVANDAMREPASPRSEKNRAGKIVAESAPYSAKSNHSSAEPMVPLASALLRCTGLPAGGAEDAPAAGGVESKTSLVIVQAFHSWATLPVSASFIEVRALKVA